MPEKFNLEQIVRYLFGGIVVALAFLSTDCQNFSAEAPWLKTVKDFSWVTSAGLLLLLAFVGFFSFVVYRNVVFVGAINPLKDLLGNLSGCLTYRNYIEILYKKASGKEICWFEGERIYLLAKRNILPIEDVYKKLDLLITAGIHFLYLATCAFVRSWFRIG